MNPLHLLNGKETFGVSFPMKVRSLILELSEILDIEINKLDKSIDSLKLLDIALYHKQNLIDEDFINSNLMRIEAYLGEVFIQNYGGTWQVDYNEKFNIYIPFVSINGKKISFYPYVMENLLEQEIPDIRFCFRMAMPHGHPS
ncbi:hypothetical protein [Emticicia sp. SJ17W-69]|uniref:hypothetical protein n=1 Tax=Emticicia sp. SJ17W-69 TaxID=3421657 RepID=UPI003EB94AEE